MAETISLEDFRALANRAGLCLSDDELRHLKPMYDYYLEPVSNMNALELDVEDVAVAFAPRWDPEV